MLSKALALLLLPLGAFASPVDNEARQVRPLTYEGYEAFKVDITSSTAETLRALEGIDYDQWALVHNDHIDISMAPAEIAKFKKLGLKYSSKMKDIAGAIRKEQEVAGWSGRMQANGLPDSTWFNSYHSYAEHVQFWKDLQASIPQHSQMVSSGTSLEGRDIFGLKLGVANATRTKKAVIWHGQVHAREWITGMTLEYITYSMINEFNRGNSDVVNFLNTYDFYIYPFVNPDGFIYSQTRERLWRKNRQLPPRGSSCYGVDVNRNWPHQWSTNSGGSSTNPCNQAYRGASAGSEPETKGLTRTINNIASAQGIKLYIDWHSYGNYILSPYGYTCSSFPANNAKLVRLGRETGDVIGAVYGQSFTTGPTCQTLYAVNGGSLDYVYDVSKAELSYAWELRDKGEFGFMLPADQIRPTGEENWRGMLYLLKNM
ncbi:Metallocarboxypeptidase A-like protein [Cercospora beticola]|uniref:Metallocarboxypeptidase A-like protein n=1 Tax=Cercospora beticola TaxID=122368 RepID=A0A2G5I2Q9_CERBT|nr:Metallocarboxypeptidase A-like protein [Cercospora beticola]PIA99095.1 Metallocarboxypeptidase A-like protein [Cercospora beticola]WPA99520.1 hypothetical protein RHO25_004138 [Cercospora beticola]CAK1362352.1 unnamed protein product [Cercospora beticola]